MSQLLRAPTIGSYTYLCTAFEDVDAAECLDAGAACRIAVGFVAVEECVGTSPSSASKSSTSIIYQQAAQGLSDGPKTQLRMRRAPVNGDR